MILAPLDTSHTMSSNDGQNVVNENQQNEVETTPKSLNSGPEKSSASATKHDSSLTKNVIFKEQTRESEQMDKKKHQYKVQHLEEEYAMPSSDLSIWSDFEFYLECSFMDNGT